MGLVRVLNNSIDRGSRICIVVKSGVFYFIVMKELYICKCGFRRSNFDVQFPFGF